MRFGFKTSLQETDWETLSSVWVRADAIDLFESGWVNDHLYNPYFPATSDSSHSYEAFTALASLATVTSRLRIGTLVSANLFRHPALLARMAVTIDHISDGRFELGLGAGWHEREHGDHGIDLMAPGARLDALSESLAAVRGLLDGEILSMQGSHVQLDQARLRPRPVQERMPITIGGSGEKRTLRIVAEHADHWNFGSMHDVDNFEHKCGVLRAHCEAVGRDCDDITKSIQMWVPEDLGKLVDDVAKASASGADKLILFFENDRWNQLEPAAEALADANLAG